MAKTLTIYGASDDLVEFEGAFTEEYNVYGPTYFDIGFVNPVEGLFCELTVRAEFGRRGWEILVGSTTEFPLKYPMDVTVTLRPDHDYDPAVTITVDDSTDIWVAQL